MSRIFISYSHNDRGFTERLARLLRKSFDAVWYDDSLHAGDGWLNKIKQQISQCDCLIFVLSLESIKSQYCLEEFQIALELNKHIIPIKIHDAVKIPETFNLLASLQYVDMVEAITVETLNQLYASIIRKSPNFFTNYEINPQKRELDLKFLHILWKFVISPYIAKLDGETHIEYIDYREYEAHLYAYRNLRDLKVNPHNVFFDMNLERAFSNLDYAIVEFDMQIGHTLSLHVDGKEEHFVSKRLKAKAEGRKISEETLLYYDKLQKELLNRLRDLQIAHRQIVAAIRNLYPDFNFDIGKSE